MTIPAPEIPLGTGTEHTAYWFVPPPNVDFPAIPVHPSNTPELLPTCRELALSCPEAGTQGVIMHASHVYCYGSFVYLLFIHLSSSHLLSVPLQEAG
jgi:hypothetical protein